MIQLKRKEDCTGCGACVDICPKDAIQWEIDGEGFWYPNIDNGLCVNCGACNKVCPVINAAFLNKTNSDNPIVFAAYNTNQEIRYISTTGGIFSALAEKMFELGGFVGGAVWTDGFNVKHILSKDPLDLNKIRGSKYVQSDCTGLYKKIKNILLQGGRVLICGCPCQIAALRSFLKRDHDNLITVDFICCTINSPKLFQYYLDSISRNYGMGAKVVTYHPKNKDYGGWHNFSFKAVFENGEIYHKELTNDDFTRCFIGTHIAGRPCCFECKFKEEKRIADITIGDFWGIEKTDPNMDSPNGTSVVILNNIKGITYYNSLGEKVHNKQKTIAEVSEENFHLFHIAEKPIIERNKFYKELDTIGFEKVIKKYCPNKNSTFTGKIRKFVKKVYEKLLTIINQLVINK